ncbi:MAG: GNAT family N-acetyltransferase [Proteobacteria bacterium]|nr:GNAT family N-acetyltransferase [Pseudomonadota bacterium]
MALADLPATWREVPVLAGAHVRLEPLREAHVDGLRVALAGDALSRLWFTSVPTVDAVGRYVRSALEAQAEGRVLPFAVCDAQGAPVGSTRFYRLEPDVPTLCIGYTWYAPRVQRTGLNTEAKRLLLAHAFEALGCISVVFETSTENLRSRTAIARLGAKQDGILRNHKRHADGSPRDTVVFSIIDSEWQDVKRGLLDRLQRHGAVT